MSKKNQSRARGKAKAIDPTRRAWEDVDDVTASGDILRMRLPVDRVPTPCTTGMVVTAGETINPGRVVQISPSHCIVQFEDGECDAYPWHQVQIACVVPAGMELAPACGSADAKKKIS